MRMLNLPIDVSYTLLDVNDCGEVVTACDNCGLPIRNVATIQSNNGKYGVGVDCASTLCTEANNGYALEQQLKLAKREISRISKAKRLIARGGTATLFGKNIVVCYQEDNSNKWFEVVPMFKTASTSLPSQLAELYANAPRLTCLADSRNYSTALGVTV